MPLFSLRQSDPEGELSSFSKERTRTDEAAEGTTNILKLLRLFQNFKAGKPDRDLNKAGRSAIAAELKKLQAGEDTNLDVGRDASGKVTFNLKRPRKEKGLDPILQAAVESGTTAEGTELDSAFREALADALGFAREDQEITKPPLDIGPFSFGGGQKETVQRFIPPQRNVRVPTGRGGLLAEARDAISRGANPEDVARELAIALKQGG